MTIIPEIVCLSLWMAVGAHSNPLVGDSNYETCISIAEESNTQGVNPVLAISIGWVESRFRNPVSSAGARGPLQIIPRYWCPNGRLRGCDLTKSGVAAIENFYVRYSRTGMCGGDFLNVERYNDWLNPLCHYNSGNRCNRSSRSYARTVVRIAKATSENYISVHTD